jgi:hypothetical protein
MYFVYQQSFTRQVAVTECKLKSTEAMFHCGMHHHTSIVQLRTTPLDTPVTPEQCRDAKKYGRLSLSPDREIAAKVNKTVHSRVFVSGGIYENGKCFGGEQLIDGYRYSNIVLYREYTITIASYQATFDTRTGSMLTNGYGFCSLSDGSCDTGESIVIYDPTPESCHLRLLKSTQFTEWTGHRWNLSQSAPPPLSNNKPRVSSLSMITTPTVLITDAAHDMLRFVRKKEVIHCGIRMFETNYEDIFVSSDEVKAALPNPLPSDVRLSHYFNNKVDFLYHNGLTRIEDVYRETISRDCEINRELLRTKLAFASVNPDVATPLLSPDKGIFGRVSGEALYVFRCLPVDVEARDTTECTNQLAVKYKEQDWFVEPVSRILTRKPTFILCSNIVTPRFRIQEDFWISVPYRHKVQTPRTVNSNAFPEQLSFASLDDISQKGLYSPEDIKKARNQMLFPKFAPEFSLKLFSARLKVITIPVNMIDYLVQNIIKKQPRI